jgi:hypothetical protein
MQCIHHCPDNNASCLICVTIIVSQSDFKEGEYGSVRERTNPSKLLCNVSSRNKLRPRRLTRLRKRIELSLVYNQKRTKQHVIYKRKGVILLTGWEQIGTAVGYRTSATYFSYGLRSVPRISFKRTIFSSEIRIRTQVVILWNMKEVSYQTCNRSRDVAMCDACMYV